MEFNVYCAFVGQPAHPKHLHNGAQGPLAAATAELQRAWCQSLSGVSVAWVEPVDPPLYDVHYRCTDAPLERGLEQYNAQPYSWAQAQRATAHAQYIYRRQSRALVVTVVPAGTRP